MKNIIYIFLNKRAALADVVDALRNTVNASKRKFLVLIIASAQNGNKTKQQINNNN